VVQGLLIEHTPFVHLWRFCLLEQNCCFAMTENSAWGGGALQKDESERHPQKKLPVGRAPRKADLQALSSEAKVFRLW
jgi:hypothetical protein